MIEDIILFGKSLCMDVEFQEKLSVTQKYKYGQSFSVPVSRSIFSVIYFGDVPSVKVFFLTKNSIYLCHILRQFSEWNSLYIFNQSAWSKMIHLVKTHPNKLINPNSEYIFIIFNLKWEHELPSFCYVSWVNYLFHAK